MEQTRGEPQDPRDSLWHPDRRALTLGLVLTITLVGFESLAISTVMPIVERELGGLELYGWVFSAFFLGSLIGIVVVGDAIDRGGLAIPFAAGLGLFALGLLGGGLAPSMPILVAARFLQGLGAGTIQPIAYVAIGRTLPESLRPRMFATLSSAWILPGVIGPAIAGTVGEAFHWRFVFLGLLPLIAIAGALTLGALHAVADMPAINDPGVTDPLAADRSASRRGRLPLAILVAFGSGLLTVGLTTGELLPTVVLSAIGIAIGLFALRRLTPVGTLVARPVLPAAILLRGILTCAFFCVDAFVALTLVGWRGLSATEAGFALTAATLSWTIGAWLQAHGSSRWPTHRFVRVGFAIVSVGLAGMLLVLRLDVPWVVAIASFGIAGLGMGLAYSPLALIVLREASPERQGAATSSLSLTDSLGTAFGTGLTGALVAASVRATGQPAAGLGIAFAAGSLIGLGGLALTGRLRPRQAPSGVLALSRSSPPP
ncbi:MAG: MFS transporter [Chloroflexota bacterium]